MNQDTGFDSLGCRESVLRVLVCDDDLSFRNRLSRGLRDKSYIVFEAGSVSEAIEVVEEFPVNACIADLRMPGEDGLKLVSVISAKWPEIRTVVLTGFGSIKTAVEAIKCGASQYITKPAKLDEIINAIDPEKFSLASRGDEKHSRVPPSMPSLEEVELEYINRVLGACEGNVTLAAKVLGLHRRSLQRKLQNK
ncbi:MAG TPA: response regulator [Oligoflexia bacterium]|nr:response regulator [Oligoflexia bacterium]HMP49275.1 response regulator [Oligoflexia bacterium]